MNKLHLYRWVGKFPSWCADGDGKPTTTGDFTVKITDGAVQKGIAYEIREGRSPSGENYNCKVGARKNETATFAKASDLSLASVNDEDLGATLALRAALMASQKVVTIAIDTEDLQVLKGSDYKLCFAKKVGHESYNVVWQSYTKYLVTNSFSWTPQYQLFGTNTFQDRVQVRVATNLMSIGLGEQSVLDSAGVLGAPSTGGPEISITLVNEYGSIHPGIIQLSTGLDGKQVSTPIYVAERPIVLGQTLMTPVEKVLVWFEQDIETSTMFSTSRSMSVEIDLTFTNEATRLYKGQKWTTP